MCSCEEAIAVYNNLYNNFISTAMISCYYSNSVIIIGVLHFQLKHTPDDFFVDNISKDNFLTVSLKVGMRNNMSLCDLFS